MTETFEAGQLVPVDGGEFLALRKEGAVWRFEFTSEISLEALAAWRVTEQRGLMTHVLLGSLDAHESTVASRELERILSGKELKVLCFEPDKLLASMQDADEAIQLELICLSATQENWRIIGEDFVDSDRIQLLSSRRNFA